MVQKEQLLGYRIGDTASSSATAEQRSIRLGRALDGNVMREFEYLLYTAQQPNLPTNSELAFYPASTSPLAIWGGGHLAPCLHSSALHTIDAH